MKANKKGKGYGAAGWGIVIFNFFMFYFYIALINDGTNILAPKVAENIGVEHGDVLNANGIAGVIAVIGYIIFGRLNTQIGPRKTCGIMLFMGGLSYILCGNTNSIYIYTFAMAVCAASLLSAGYVAGGNLVANWFPKKKGLVMGYVTMGNNTASVTFVALYAWLVNQFGGQIKLAVIPVGIAVMVLGVIGWLFVRNTPQERGQNPDNVTDEEYAEEYFVEESDGGWTVGKLLKTKEVWLAALYTGLLQTCSIGVMMQLVQRNMDTFHMTQNKAILLMSILALIALVCSWLIGVLDDKVGTKRAMQIFCLWYAVAFLVNVFAVGRASWIFYLSIFMIAMGIGGSGNFTISLPASIFGRHGFDKVNSVLFPIQGFFTAWCFLIDGTIYKKYGNLTPAYILFAGISIFVMIAISFLDEHKYNKDYQAELKHEKEIKEKG